MLERQLRIFLEVYRLKSMSGAAKALHMAQPAVSKAIKDLEVSYGVVLFERLHQRIYPTVYGDAVFAYALRLEEVLRDAPNIKMLEVHPRLNLGATMMIGTHIVPGLIASLKKEYTDLEYTIAVLSASQIEEGILYNTLDLGLVESYSQDKSLVHIPFAHDELVCIACTTLDQDSFSFIDLGKMPLLMRQKGSATRRMVDAYFDLHHIPSHIVMESASTSAIIEAVRYDLGIAFLPIRLVQEALDKGLVKRMAIPKPIERTLYIIHHPQKFQTPIFASLLKGLLEVS